MEQISGENAAVDLGTIEDSRGAPGNRRAVPRGVGQAVGLAEPFVWERGAGDPQKVCFAGNYSKVSFLPLGLLLKNCEFILQRKKESKKSWEFSIK